jgi:hypothetical protein
MQLINIYMYVHVHVQWRVQDLKQGGAKHVRKIVNHAPINVFFKLAGWQRGCFRPSSDEKLLFRKRILGKVSLLLAVATTYRFSVTIIVTELLSWLLSCVVLELRGMLQHPEPPPPRTWHCMYVGIGTHNHVGSHISFRPSGISYTRKL